MTSAPSTRELHKAGFEALDGFWETLDRMEASVREYAEVGLNFVDEPVERVLDRIQAFEPSVSIIGQVKAGKSTLLNALIGQPGLLPSDVNPWTSVITGLHLNARHRPPETAALFRFFDEHEWDRLVATGGRLGEMAARAGFQREADEVRAQVTEMREATETRLGESFTSLLGTSHAFPTLDKDTIDRYICYGDPDDLAEGAQEGVFADITKSADLYIDLPGLPRGLCLRDTPGVNDTFMMREQITLNAISDSRVCVVVLSAHQALSTMDMALLRIICAVEAREVVIFVNRIDELADPAGEMRRIEASIRKTLSRLGLAEGVEILFGSGVWANAAIDPEGCPLSPASRAALAAFSGFDTPEAPEVQRTAMLMASGIPALHRLIAKRVVEGPGQALLKDVQAEMDAIADMSETIETIAHRPGGHTVRAEITADHLSARLNTARDAALTAFDVEAQELRAHLRERLDRAQETFVDSAVEALQAHIDHYGEASTWKHDPTSLRMAMKTAFISATARLRRTGENALDAVLEGSQMVLQEDLGVFRDTATVDFPAQPQHAAPTVLARTLSLDLEGPWWRKFWRFGTQRAAEKRYRALIVAETTPLIEDLVVQFFDPAVARSREIVETFARDQGKFAQAILECARDPRGYETQQTGRKSA